MNLPNTYISSCKWAFLQSRFWCCSVSSARDRKEMRFGSWKIDGKPEACSTEPLLWLSGSICKFKFIICFLRRQSKVEDITFQSHNIRHIVFSKCVCTTEAGWLAWRIRIFVQCSPSSPWILPYTLPLLATSFSMKSRTPHPQAQKPHPATRRFEDYKTRQPASEKKHRRYQSQIIHPRE